jgi:glycosyltransferase involved in cell wall biosynthesis
MSPLVSITITTKNEEKNITACLQSIKNQNFPQNKIEIIVVDNNSTDKTKQFAKQFTIHVFNAGPERSAQRNFGAEKSHGTYYMYLDADMILTPNILKESVKKFEKSKQLKGLYMPEIVLGSGYWSRVRRFERSFYNATVIDCVRMVRKEDFEKINGFDVSMSGPEDWDFDKKIRNLGKTEIISEPIFHNEAAFNLKKYIEKKGYYAKSFKTYVNKWGSNDTDIRKQLGIRYRLIGVFTENGKWKKLLTHPILTLGMIALRCLVGYKYLQVKLSR